MTMQPLFPLQHLNDVDHIAPVIWKCLEIGNKVTAVLLDLAYNYGGDPRLTFLLEYDTFELVPIDEFLSVWTGRSLFELDGGFPQETFSTLCRRFFRKTGLSTRWSIPALRDINSRIRSHLESDEKPMTSRNAYDVYVTQRSTTCDTRCVSGSIRICMACSAVSSTTQSGSRRTHRCTIPSNRRPEQTKR